jgi:hypothetical protein
MSRMRSMALPALLALAGLGLWGSSAAAQYVGGGTTYAPGYYYAPSPGCYGPGYYGCTQPAAGFYDSPAPAPCYAASGPYSPAPAPAFRSSVVVPGGSSGWNYPANPSSGRPVPWRGSGLEPESLPAQITEDRIQASATSRPGPVWWRGRIWGRTSRDW